MGNVSNVRHSWARRHSTTVNLGGPRTFGPAKENYICREWTARRIKARFGYMVGGWWVCEPVQVEVTGGYTGWLTGATCQSSRHSPPPSPTTFASFCQLRPSSTATRQNGMKTTMERHDGKDDEGRGWAAVPAPNWVRLFVFYMLHWH